MENRKSMPDEYPISCLRSLGALNLGIVHAVKLFAVLEETAPDVDKIGSFLLIAIKQ